MPERGQTMRLGHVPPTWTLQNLTNKPRDTDGAQRTSRQPYFFIILLVF